MQINERKILRVGIKITLKLPIFFLVGIFISLTTFWPQISCAEDVGSVVGSGNSIGETLSNFGMPSQVLKIAAKPLDVGEAVSLAVDVKNNRLFTAGGDGVFESFIEIYDLSSLTKILSKKYFRGDEGFIKETASMVVDDLSQHIFVLNEARGLPGQPGPKVQVYDEKTLQYMSGIESNDPRMEKFRGALGIDGQQKILYVPFGNGAETINTVSLAYISSLHFEPKPQLPGVAIAFDQRDKSLFRLRADLGCIDIYSAHSAAQTGTVGSCGSINSAIFGVGESIEAAAVDDETNLIFVQSEVKSAESKSYSVRLFNRGSSELIATFSSIADPDICGFKSLVANKGMIFGICESQKDPGHNTLFEFDINHKQR